MYELVLFAMLGMVMFVSKIVMEFLPNIHLLGMLTMVYTIVFRTKALIPIYVYVFVNGLYAGFAMWWVPYLYVWTVLWAVDIADQTEKCGFSRSVASHKSVNAGIWDLTAKIVKSGEIIKFHSYILRAYHNVISFLRIAAHL